MQHLSRALDLVTLFVARGLPAGSRAVLIMLLANRMDKSAFGAMAAAFVLVETLRVAFDCGQDTISIKLLSRPGKLWQRSLHAAIRIKTFTWLGGCTLDLILLRVFMSSIDAGTATAIGLIGVSQLFWNLPINLMQARGWLNESRTVLWMVCVGLPASIGLAAWVLPGYEAVRVYAFMEYVALGAMALIARHAGRLHRAGLDEGRRLRGRQLSLYLRRGWNVCVGQIAALTYGKFDVLLVARFAPATSVADYLFVQRFFDLANFVAGGASSVMYATIARKTGRVIPSQAWTAAAKQWALAFTLLAAAVGMAFWLVGPVLIRTFFPRMSGAVGIIYLFGIVAVLSVVNQYVTALLNSVGGYSVIARVNVVNLLMILIAGSAAFYWFGIPWLLVSIAVVYFIAPLLQGLALKQLLQQPRVALAN